MVLKPKAPDANQMATVITQDEAVDTNEIEDATTPDSDDNVIEADDVEVIEELPQEPIEWAVIYTIADNSELQRKGRKPGGEHYGIALITDGNLQVKDDNIVGWEFEVDMTTIKVQDIESEDLENHLMAEDFFDVTNYATATFVVKKATPIEEPAADETATHMIQGDLTIKGKTQTIEFKSVLAMNEETVTATSTFFIDRNLRGIDGSKGVIDDFIEFTLDLTRNKAV